MKHLSSSEFIAYLGITKDQWSLGHKDLKGWGQDRAYAFWFPMDSDAGPVLSSGPSWHFQSLLGHLDIYSLLHPFLQSRVSNLLLQLLAQFCKPHNDG